jgi:hypothetical protein
MNSDTGVIDTIDSFGDERFYIAPAEIENYTFAPVPRHT